MASERINLDVRLARYLYSRIESERSVRERQRAAEASRWNPSDSKFTSRRDIIGMDADLKKLWRISSRTLGPALKGAFQALWVQAGAEPNHIVVTKRWLGDCCGAEPRTAGGWIQQLAEKGLVAVVDRDETRGTIHLFVYRPTVLFGEPPRHNEYVQQQLPLTYGGEKATGPPGVSARKPPPPDCREIDVIPEEDGSLAVEQEERVGVSARKPPTPPGVSARKPPPPGCREIDVVSEESGNLAIEQEERVGVSARKPPPPERHLDLDLDLDVEVDRRDFFQATEACRRQRDAWVSKRIIPDRPMDPRNAELMLQARILSIRLFSEEWWQESVDAVCSARPDRPFGYFRTCLRKSTKKLGYDFDALLDSFEIPRIEASPNGEQPQLE